MARLFSAVILACMVLGNLVNAQSVVAHFMAQNSYSYTIDDWKNDINSAKSIGIDAFALNVALMDYEVDKIKDAFSAAESIGFKLLFSFDMNYSWSADDMANLVAAHASSSSMYKWNNAVLVSTFSGENQGNDFWDGFKSLLSSKGVAVSLAPAFTGYRNPSQASALLSTFPSIDGFFNWWSWPDDVNALLTTDTDIAYKNAISARTGPYIMAVSPWQFKNLDGAGNWVELSDTLWNYRWQQAIEVKPDIVEIVTWNDYGESHYISDIISKVDLGSQAPLYVNGFDHSAWRDVAQYYISYFKTGTAPAITKDEVVFWYRAYPKAVTCSTGTRPRNADFVEDAVFALAMLKEAATVQLSIGSNTVTFNAGAGLTMNKVAFPKEDAQIPYIAIIRNGATVADIHGSKYVNQSGCTYYNFNPWVGKLTT